MCILQEPFWNSPPTRTHTPKNNNNAHHHVVQQKQIVHDKTTDCRNLIIWRKWCPLIHDVNHIRVVTFSLIGQGKRKKMEGAQHSLFLDFGAHTCPQHQIVQHNAPTTPLKTIANTTQLESPYQSTTSTKTISHYYYHIIDNTNNQSIHTYIHSHKYVRIHNIYHQFPSTTTTTETTKTTATSPLEEALHDDDWQE